MAGRRTDQPSANVELVRAALPRPGNDLIALFSDDSANGQLVKQMAPLLHPDFVAVKHFPGGAEPDISHGLHGLRAGWLDWLPPRGRHRAESEGPSDPGGTGLAGRCD